jgi:hypothetical protein
MTRYYVRPFFGFDEQSKQLVCEEGGSVRVIAFYSVMKDEWEKTRTQMVFKNFSSLDEMADDEVEEEEALAILLLSK